MLIDLTKKDIELLKDTVNKDGYVRLQAELNSEPHSTRDQLIAERACNLGLRESLKRRDEKNKELKDQVAELLRYKETHEAGKRALRKILNPQATAYEVHEDIDRLIRDVRELACREKELRETNNVWIGGVDWSHDHTVKMMKENEELRLYKEEHERLKRELNRILHPDGDGPENPSLSDLVACVRDDIRHYKDETDDMKSAIRAKSTIIEKQCSTIMRLNKALARP